MLVLLPSTNVCKNWYINCLMSELRQSECTHWYKLLDYSYNCYSQLTPLAGQDKGLTLTNVVKYFIFKNPVPLSLLRGNEFNIFCIKRRIVNRKYTWQGAGESSALPTSLKTKLKLPEHGPWPTQTLPAILRVLLCCAFWKQNWPTILWFYEDLLQNTSLQTISSQFQ